MTIWLVRRFASFGRRFGRDVTMLGKSVEMNVVPQMAMIILIDGFQFIVDELTVDPPGKISVYHQWELPDTKTIEAAKAAGWEPS